MRILQVIPSLAARFGGPPKAAQELCRELVRRGEEVCIYTTDIDGSDRLQVPLDSAARDKDGVECWYFSTRGSGLYGVSVPLANTLRRNVRNFDVVHIHSLYRFSTAIAAFYCRRYRVPYIMRPHGTLDPYIYQRHRMRKAIYEKLIENRNLERAAAVHFTAAEELSLAQSTGIKFRGVVVPLGIDVSLPSSSRDELRAQFAHEWPQTRGKQIILFFGRITQKKGLDLLAKAFGRVACERPDIHLFLAGPDDEGHGQKVREWLTSEGVLDRTTFAGMLTGRRKECAFATADLFVLPSYTENFGLAVIEALASGVPCVISNRVNIWRELSSAEAALVVKCDAVEVASAIVTLLDSLDLRKSLSDAGKRLVADQYTWSTAADRMIALYRDVAASRTNSPRQRALWSRQPYL